MYNEQEHKNWSSQTGNLPQTVALNYQTGSSEPSDEEKVLKEVAKLLAAARRRAIVIGAVTIAVSAGLIYKLSNRAPVYQGSFQLLVEPVNASESRLQAILTETEGNRRATYNGKDFGLDYSTQIRVLKSPTVMKPIMEEIKKEYSDVTPGDIVVERPFEESVGTRIIKVSYTHGDPKKIKFVLDKVHKGYLYYSKESRLSNLRNGIEFIESTLPALRKRVNDLQTEIQALRQKHDLMEPDFQGRKLLEQSNFLEGKRVEAQAKLAQARVRYATLKKMFDEGNMAAVLSQDMGAFGTLIREAQATEGKMVAASARLEEEHPTLKALREEQQGYRNLLRREAQSIMAKTAGEIRELEERDSAIASAQNILNQRTTILPVVSRRYADLQRELQVATDTLNRYLSKLDGLQIDAKVQEYPWQAIAPPGKPKKLGGATRKTKILTVIVGLVLGIGAAFLLEILNNVFHTPEELEDDTKLPLLAVIPFAREFRRRPHPARGPGKQVAPVGVGVSAGTMAVASERTVRGAARAGAVQWYGVSPLVEAFRTLYTNIRLLSPEEPIHSLVISAAKPGEGKSTVAMHLAQTAAAIGQRVLLVDADMRSPKLHTKLDLPNLQGLSDAISTDLSLNDAIQRSPSDDNLFVLTAGAISSDPIKLLSSKKMNSLMEQFQDFFDLVIYDTPPLVGLADGSILAAQTDGIVMVVGIDKTDRPMVTKALDGLRISGSRVLGLVANCIKG
ncbi:MAG: polysaccharide biosynthesis tyrosine autokinase [Oscillatoria sp. SIO1A7]|nr:polysaccharide biosynthesis tyrosine autokinase [Oscillatoria sp. SIO1A7]